MGDGTLFEVRPTDGIDRTAIVSDDGIYRYVLGRRWSTDESAFATFVMLNPSTADATVDDPTIRRCVSFARSWGMGGLHVLNLYAFRATDPSALWTADDPVGPENDKYLLRHLHAHRSSGWPLVAAWGANARLHRVAAVLDMHRTAPWQCLGLTKDRHPRHPLYVKGGTPLVAV